MSIKVLYFASLRETLGYSHETLTLPASIATLGDLRSLLARRGGREVGQGLNRWCGCSAPWVLGSDR